ncbi:ATP-binding protein [Maribacter sp.]|uniref:ATP-binding protein n=1 Tax=Maribacter sp. TaxID=1897614 RepID=UPI0025BB5D32|nr:ATP-binding protein [Maribacter sp.]
MNIEKLIGLKESEDKVEFKEASGGNISYNGGGKVDISKRRRCILGYVIAFANEGGGYLVFGIKESIPHIVVGSKQNENTTGELESNIYRDTGIRVLTKELFDQNGKRVLVIEIPSRPIGRVFKFEDVPLMRVGDQLKPMSDAQYLKIIQEQEPDFSEKICLGLTLNDLDDDAIRKMKEAYSKKQNNTQFLTLSKEQVLTDLNLVIDDKVTNAAVILLGKKNIIRKNIPQASIMLEYRKDEGKITFDQRHSFSGPFFLETDSLWEKINLRNGSFPIQEGPFIFNIPYFNNEVIREAINNAIAHRNYGLTSETVIKQYDSRLDIISPGGFPVGVNLENLITISSTPRNRLLTDVLQKTGIVERSGQGIDKIYYQTLKEGKSEPDYSKSDAFQVELRLSAIIEDKAFALFIESVQSELNDDNKLSVQEIIHLNHIRKVTTNFIYDKNIIKQLLSRELIEQRGKTKGTYYVLSKAYYEFSDEKGKYSKTNWDKDQAFIVILQHLKKFEKAKMKDFVDLFQGRLSRKQVRIIVSKLVENKELKKSGIGKGTYYDIGENYIKSMEVLSKALHIGLQQMENNKE